MGVLEVIVFIVIVVVVIFLARILLNLLGRVVGCAITLLVAAGLLFGLWFFFIR